MAFKPQPKSCEIPRPSIAKIKEREVQKSASGSIDPTQIRFDCIRLRRKFVVLPRELSKLNRIDWSAFISNNHLELIW